jgi:hypothetical protein
VARRLLLASSVEKENHVTKAKKGTSGGKGPRKLKLKKETLKDLSARDRTARGVKGGMQNRPTVTCGCTVTCQTVCKSCGNTDCCLMQP